MAGGFIYPRGGRKALGRRGIGRKKGVRRPLCPPHDLLTPQRRCYPPSMPIVMSFAPGVNSYIADYSHTRPDIEVWCPDCNTVMNPWDYYYRHPRTRDGRMCIRIYRWRCPKCGRTCGVLPDFLAPYLPHLTEVRESCVRSHLEGATIEEAAEEAGVDARTVSRWVARARHLLDGAVSLVSKLVAGLTVIVTWPRVKAEGTRGHMLLLFDLGDILCGATVTRGAPGIFPRINAFNILYL